LARRSKAGRSRPQQEATSPVAQPYASESLEKVRRLNAIIFLFLGLCIFLALGLGNGIGWQRWVVIGVGVLISLIPAVSRIIRHILNELAVPSESTRRWSPLIVWVGATGFLIVTAFAQGRGLFPKTHDEYSYYLGMQMLARGRLWMPPHPLGDFFGSFYILSKPVYASIYFPGTALMFAPAVWLSLPVWVLPAMAGGAIAALVFWISRELIDGAAGWIAILLLLSSTWFRTISMMLMSQGPMLLLGLAVVWAWLRWRRGRSGWWLLSIGIFAGWGAITRPIDAIIFAAPVGVAILADLVKGPTRRGLMATGLVVAGAAPFLLMQGVFNVGVTGHLTQTPYTLYLQREQPGATFGFHTFDPSTRGRSTLPQMQRDLEFSKTYFAMHQPGNFWKPWLVTRHPTGFADRPSYFAMIADTTLPIRLLVILLPVGLLAMFDRRRWIVLSTFPLFVLLYALNPFFLEHYAIVLIPAVILCLLLSVRVMAEAWPRYRNSIVSGLTSLIVIAALTGFWEINHLIVTDPRKQVSDEPLPSKLVQHSYALHGIRAVVLFRWDPTRNWKEEPVFNSGVAWPDDAEVIRAHDLGARDSEIVDYYGRIQPDRTFFLWDQKIDELRTLGPAGELRKALQAGQPINQLMHAGG
jgi:hypothetical protein